MKKLLGYCMLFMVGSASLLHAEPLSLTEAYKRALTYDAKLKVAEAGNAAQQEEIGKARANFRPSIRLSGAVGRNGTESTSLVQDVSSDYFYNTQNYGVVVRQPVFNMSNFAAYRQSKAVAAKSEALLSKERSALFARTLEAYVNVLFSRDNIAFSQAHAKAVKEQMQQARLRYATGSGTLTEIKEAEADYEMALADGLASTHNLENNRRELENITGVYADSLLSIVHAKVSYDVPRPHDISYWVEYALDQNSEVKAAKQEIRIAKEQVRKNRASRYPTIDLVASRTFSESDNNYSIGTQYDTYGVTLQMSLPIYSGGYVSASVRQASAQFWEAGERKNLTERTVTSDVRKYYNGILSSIAQVNAYDQAVKSSEIALIGTQKGFQTGLRSNVDVLNAQAKLFENKRNFAKAQYQYIMNLAMFKQVTGTLSESDMDMINGWMK